MAERFQELYRLPSKLYVDGSPVVIEAGVLLKDKNTNQVLAQIKIRNIDYRIITACKISVRAFEPNGLELEGVPTFLYLDVKASIGEEFGSRVPVYLPCNSTRKISVSVIEVVFSDSSVWKGDIFEWYSVPKQESMKEKFLDEELVKQVALDIGEDCKYIPVMRDELFLCSCGAINKSDANKCYQCGRDYVSITQKLDYNSLMEHKTERIKKEAEDLETARRIAAEKEKIHLKRIKLITFVTASFVALVSGVFLYQNNIKPSMRYKEAMNLMDGGYYAEARDLFLENQEYKDSKDKIEECNKAILSVADVGDTVCFGEYDLNDDGNKEDIEWIVMEKNGSLRLLYSKYCVAYMPFCENVSITPEKNTWPNSSIRKWLNTSFLDAFETYEQEIIINSEVEFPNVVEGEVVDLIHEDPKCYQYYEEKYYGEKTIDKIFLFAASDVNKYSSLITGNALYGRELNIPIFLRGPVCLTVQQWSETASVEKSYSIQVYGGATFGDTSKLDDKAGIRPAMWIDLE